MVVYIIKTTQNNASIMNSSAGLLSTEEYFTVARCYGSNKNAYDLRRIFSSTAISRRNFALGSFNLGIQLAQLMT